MVIQVEERLSHARGQCIDHDRFLRAGHLDHAEQGVVGRLTQKFGVDGNDGVPERRSQTAASSAVVVIRFMQGP